jgi:hypothetical protein
MSAIQPKTWEGKLKLLETSEGSNLFDLRPHSDGKYSAENLPELFKAIAGAKAKLSGWRVWVDGDFDVKHTPGEDVSPATLAKLIKEADNVELVFVKRPWPQPKVKFTKGTGNGPTRTARKAPREL